MITKNKPKKAIKKALVNKMLIKIVKKKFRSRAVSLGIDKEIMTPANEKEHLQTRQDGSQNRVERLRIKMLKAVPQENKTIIGKKIYALKILEEEGLEAAKSRISEKYHAYLNNLNGNDELIEKETLELNKKFIRLSAL